MRSISPNRAWLLGIALAAALAATAPTSAASPQFVTGTVCPSLAIVLTKAATR